MLVGSLAACRVRVPASGFDGGHRMRFSAAILCILALTACQREKRELRPSPARVFVFGDAARQDDLQPGGAKTMPHVENPSHGNAYDISEGQRLFNWYNC